SITDFEVGLDLGDNYDFPAAWGNDANGEVGDVCDASDSITGEGGTTSYTVQLIYSNRKNLCVSSVLAVQDFKVFMQPDTASVAKGKSVVIPVSTGITAGAAQPLALSASRLPAGVSGSFHSASINSGRSAELTLPASAPA